jgi:hypothetical protein
MCVPPCRRAPPRIHPFWHVAEVRVKLEEHADPIAETCAHTNEFVEVLLKMTTFLEHGKPKRRGTAATKVASRDNTSMGSLRTPRSLGDASRGQANPSLLGDRKLASDPNPGALEA